MKWICCFCESWESGGIESFLASVYTHADLSELEIDIVTSKLLDSVFTLVVVVPIAYVLCYWTDMDVSWVYACVEAADIIKFLIALPILISGSWARNVINTGK